VSIAALTSNGIKLRRSSRYFAPLRGSKFSLVADGSARSLFAEEGHLLVRDALPRDVVLELREAYFRLFDPRLLKDGDARRGEFSGYLPEGLAPHGVTGHPAHTFVRTERFIAFRQLPVFRAMAEALLGGPVKPVWRTPLRHFIRGSNVASRAHLDRTYLDCGIDSCVTIWVPIGDCPLQAGGLLYLEKSHTDPSIESMSRASGPMDRPDRRPLTHDLKWLAEATGRRWLGADYRAGDVVLHSPAIVHASTDPQTDLMRVSTDIRFLRADAPSDPRWQSDWSADDGF
jgi:hypothetical protein